MTSAQTMSVIVMAAAGLVVGFCGKGIDRRFPGPAWLLALGSLFAGYIAGRLY